jgi:hypothetical protein
MNLTETLRRLHEQIDRFNPPASTASLGQLQDAIGRLNDEIIAIYRDHNGSASRLSHGQLWLSARLMPIDEVR